MVHPTRPQKLAPEPRLHDRPIFYLLQNLRHTPHRYPLIHSLCPSKTPETPFFTWSLSTGIWAPKCQKVSQRGFALHPKDALPTNMGFHHSRFTGRILPVGFLGAPPNGPPKIVGI